MGLGASLATVGVCSFLIPKGTGSRSFFTTAAANDEGYRNRVFTPVRQESELERLLTLPTPLLTNFCIYNDPTSKTLSRTLQYVVERRTSNHVNMVDVEADEPGVKDLLPRFMVSNIPTIVAIRGGLPIDKFEVKTGEPITEESVKAWVDQVGK